MNQKHWAMAQKAETLRLSDAYQDVIEIFTQLLDKYPDNAWINAHLGTTYYQLLDYGKAEDYLKKAIAENDKYLWAHAQLGETYRLRAITEYKESKEKYITLAIEHFKIAIDAEKPENSNYAWALAHLGATYRLQIPENIKSTLDSRRTKPRTNCDSIALDCLNRAIELIPTYAWAWGMRSTVYRLQQEYEDSFWDLGTLIVIAPEIGVLQNSSSPVPLADSRRVNLHEHAFLHFYLTKQQEDEDKKNRHYVRAIACAKEALVFRPYDLIAQLMLIVIEANQAKEKQGGTLSDPNDIKKIEKQVKKFFKDAEPEFFDLLQRILRNLIAAGKVDSNELELIQKEAGEKHKLTKAVLNGVIKNPDRGVEDDPQLWLWQNFGSIEVSSSALFLLSDLSCILQGEGVIGTAKPYRDLAAIIDPDYMVERLYQTPVLSEDERCEICRGLSDEGRLVAI
ncbi:MAG: tetratricopeptide repeat protein [Calothrix sp. MO_167.B42]|nr:tetratricopeptide repeat protein [Calothrix sp. MO_167.B42]